VAGVKEKKVIWNNLLRAEKKSRSGKFNKLLRAPFVYPSLMVFNYFLYPVLKRGIYLKANTFFNIPMRTLLPSGTDIVLNGIKSHDSEIRLSKYLVKTLDTGDVFIDVGAHFGYYSLLASSLVGEKGKVYSIEASLSSYTDLKENVDSIPSIKTFHAAAGEKAGDITFYEYPGPYAEYNTIIPGAYVNQAWYKTVKEIVNTVPILMLDQLISQEKIEKAVIKIDVEGGESSVLRGMSSSLKNKSLIIAMEYLVSTDGSKNHQDAAKILYEEGYGSFAMIKNGDLISVPLIDDYLKEMKLNSDNILFLKP
jgi:FkbM family methyltransferase